MPTKKDIQQSQMTLGMGVEEPQKQEPSKDMSHSAQSSIKTKSPEFQKISLDFSTLNKEQLEAVTTIDGPVLIIAGPGTGKTTILTYRIAHILKVTDTRPQSILAMTFTEAGVYAMKSKLTQLIGADAYKVNITTIHGFCNTVIQENPEDFLAISGFTPLSDLEKIQMTKVLLEDTRFNALAPASKPDLYLTTLPRLISTLKREYISTERLSKAIEVEQTILDSLNKYVTRGPNKGKKVTDEYQRQENYISKLKELVLFYELYQKELANRQRYDYEDMIVIVLDALKSNEDLLVRVQEKYQYFLVDEYQDTNDSQNELLFTLASYWGQEANFFAVGDDDQSIYRFQGASVKNIKDFLRTFPDAKVITLKENYRSQQTVLDVSREFVRHNTATIENLLPNVAKNLISKANQQPRNLKKATLTSQTAENLFISDEIKKFHEEGIPYEEIAILARDNRDLDDIADILQRKKIPYVRKSGNNVLENRYVNQLLKILECISDVAQSPNDDECLFTILHYPYFELPKLAIIKLSRAISTMWDKNLWEVMQSQNRAELLKDLDVSQEDFQKLVSFFDRLSEWETESHTNTITKLIEKVINESGLLSHLISIPEKYQELNALNSFFSEVKKLNTTEGDLSLKQLLEILNLMKMYRIPIKEEELGQIKGGVNLITAHSSKGLEFEYVFLPKLYYKKWDNKVVRDLLALPSSLISETQKTEQIEEERRLFYVALTRARKNVYLTRALSYTDDYGKTSEQQESQFMSELAADKIDEVNTTQYQELITNQLETLLKVNPYANVYINTAEEKEVLRAIVSRYRLSPTNLNTYLYCPMEFLLRVVLRTPSAMNPSLIYGNAYHKALEQYYVSYLSKKERITNEKFYAAFEAELAKYPLTQPQRERLKQKGQKNLTMYYESLASQPILTVKTEHKIYSTPLSGALLTGKLDRVDMVDRDKKYLLICDYKTGSACTQADLEKKPSLILKKEDKGQRYYNQLMFYRILTDLDPYFSSFAATAVQGKLIFVDPVKEVFEERYIDYNREDVEDMKQVIIETWNNIQKLDFPRKHQKTNDECEYCGLGI